MFVRCLATVGVMRFLCVASAAHFFVISEARNKVLCFAKVLICGGIVMPIVEAKCTNCGHALKVDNSKDAAVCEFCGSAFIVEKAINNYISNNHYKIEHANINMTDEHSVENRLENAEVFYTKLNQPEKALELFTKVSENAPGDYRGWWGIARVLSEEFTLKECGMNKYSAIESAVNNALSVAPAEKKEDMLTVWKREKVMLYEYVDKLREKVKKAEEDLSALNEYYEKQKSEVDYYYEEAELLKRKSQKKGKALKAIGIILGSFWGLCWSLSFTADIAVDKTNPLTWLLFFLSVISFFTPYLIKKSRSLALKRANIDYESSYNKLQKIINQRSVKQKELKRAKHILSYGMTEKS